MKSKFCQSCKEFLPREAYGVVKTDAGFRASHRCILCTKLKAALKEKKRAERVLPCVIRARELALIPNPYQKVRPVVPEILNYHWLGVV
jgi:hypothetical protein